MEKKAKTDCPIHDLIAKRWSPRAFSAKPVSREELYSLFEAARWAPSAFNDQPWSFIAARKEDPFEFERMLNCLFSKNQTWAKHTAVLIMAIARTFFQHNSKPNRHAFYDVGQAVATMTVQAESKGLRVHQMAGFSGEKARETFRIPEGHEPVTAIAIGYPGDPATLPDDLKQAELSQRTRLPASEFVFTGMWKNNPDG